MGAAVGTIPYFSTYQAGALPIASTVYLEIVDSLSATSALSYNMSQQDLVGKAPSIIPNANPAASDRIAYYQVASGLPKACSIGDLGIPSGNLPTGGATGTFLSKNSLSNFDAGWTSIISGTSATTLGVIGTTLLTGTFGVVGTTLLTGVLGVVGTSTMTGVVKVLGTSIITGSFNVNGTATFTSGAFGISGTTLATGTFGVVGTTLATGAFGAVGTATFTGTFGIVGSTLVTGTFGIVGTTLVTGSFGVVGTALFTSGAFGVVGTALFTSGAFGIAGTTLATGTFGIVGTTNFTGAINQVGTAIIFGNFRLTQATGSLGYGVGAGNATTQITSKATGVTLNNVCGQITTFNDALASSTAVSFSLANSAIATTDTLLLNHISGGSNFGYYALNARCFNGTAAIDICNNATTSLSESLRIQFTLIKSVIV